MNNYVINMNMNMDFDIDEINRKACHEILDALPKNDRNFILTLPFIRALSNKPNTDRALVQSFSSDEVVLKSCLVNGKILRVKCFTPRGLARYVYEGDIISYEHVCRYYGIPLIDRTKIQMAKLFCRCVIDSDEKTSFTIDKLYNCDTKEKRESLLLKKNAIIQFLFKKRKVLKINAEIGLNEILSLIKDNAEVDQDVLEFCIEFLQNGINPIHRTIKTINDTNDE